MASLAEIQRLVEDEEFKQLPIVKQRQLLRALDPSKDPNFFDPMLERMKSRVGPGQEAIAPHLPSIAAQAGMMTIPGLRESRLGLGLAQALAGSLGYAASGNPQVGAQGILPGVGDAIGQALTPPAAGPLKQGIGSAVGGLLGYGANVGLGIEEPNLMGALATGGMPAAAGAGLEGANFAARHVGRQLPGMEMIMGREAFERADDQWRSFAPSYPSKNLYDVLSESAIEGGAPKLANTNMLNTQAELLQKHLQRTPGSIPLAEQRLSGFNTYTEANAQLPKLANTLNEQTTALGKAQVRVAEARRRVREAQASLTPNSPPDQIERVDLLERKLRLAEEDVTNVQNRMTLTSGNIKEYEEQLAGLSQAKDQPVTFFQDELKRLSAKINAAKGEQLGLLKQQRKAVWKDLEQAEEFHRGLKEANKAFRTELALEELKGMTADAIKSNLGQITVDGQALHAKFYRQMYSQRDDFLYGAFTPEQVKGMEEFYSQLARETAAPNRIGMVVGTSMAGGMIGEATGLGWQAGSLVGVTLPNQLTQLAASSPRVRRFFHAILHAGEGTITPAALSTIVQIAQQDRARRSTNSTIEYIVHDEEEEEDTFNPLPFAR